VVTCKIVDDVFDASPQTAVQVAGDAFCCLHDDTHGETEVPIFAPHREEPPTEVQDDFWPFASRARRGADRCCDAAWDARTST
jgi:hypothetical protein